jgi:hypothetical protein
MHDRHRPERQHRSCKEGDRTLKNTTNVDFIKRIACFLFHVTIVVGLLFFYGCGESQDDTDSIVNSSSSISERVPVMSYQAQLANLALGNESTKVRLGAIAKIIDQNVLSRLAVEDTDLSVCLAALDRIHNPLFLLLLSKDERTEVREKARGKLLDNADSVVASHRLFLEIALVDDSGSLSRSQLLCAAADVLGDIRALKRLLDCVPLRQPEYVRIILDRLQAPDETTDQAVLELLDSMGVPSLWVQDYLKGLHDRTRSRVKIQLAQGVFFVPPDDAFGEEGARYLESLSRILVRCHDSRGFVLIRDWDQSARAVHGSEDVSIDWWNAYELAGRDQYDLNIRWLMENLSAVRRFSDEHRWIFRQDCLAVHMND